MIGTALAVFAGLLALASWFQTGWLKWIPLILALCLSVFSFLYYVKERSGNAAMFLGCLVTWLSFAVQLFLAGYI